MNEATRNPTRCAHSCAAPGCCWPASGGRSRLWLPGVRVVARQLDYRRDGGATAELMLRSQRTELQSMLDALQGNLERAREATPFVRDAINVYHAGQFPQAIALYEEALSRDSGNWYIRDLLGYSQVQRRTQSHARWSACRSRALFRGCGCAGAAGHRGKKGLRRRLRRTWDLSMCTGPARSRALAVWTTLTPRRGTLSRRKPSSRGRGLSKSRARTCRQQLHRRLAGQ